MSTESMTLTKALAELKLLSARIDKKLSNLEPVAMRRGTKFHASIKSQAEFEKEAKASWQSMFDLMKRRRRIKAALVITNASTMLTVNGEEMTIADAIERKNMLDLEQNISRDMRHKLTKVEKDVDSHNLAVNEKLLKLLESTYAKRESQVSKEDHDRIAKPFMESNEAKLVDPLNLKKTLDAMEDKYETFFAEVDVCLSVANATTTIEI